MNFLPNQYNRDNLLPINHNYLQQQFSDNEEIFSDIKKLVLRGDFTLGEMVNRFESSIRDLTGSAFALGVGSGTDALRLSLIAAGVKPGDEVITTPYTFYATIGAIVTVGARPVFVDIAEDYNINVDKLELAITERTKAILPVHWAGRPCDMEKISTISKKYNLVVIEDACHALTASFKGRQAGRYGATGCFSLHPLKNLNVWGDGGFIITDDSSLYEHLSLLRNHGLADRDTCEIFAFNTRLDTLQAIVGNHMLKRLPQITAARINNAKLLDSLLCEIDQISRPTRLDYITEVYHLYVIRAESRDLLQRHLIGAGIDAKIHYPKPMHLQPAAKYLGYTSGDFPVCERICDSVLSLPVHEFISVPEIHRMVESIKSFYAKS